MGWATYGHATVSRRNPRALGVCDRCGFVYNRDQLKWQYQWVGMQEFNLRILVCRSCMDEPQPQLKTIILPGDPVPILNPRPGEYAGMVISSSPGQFATIVPSPLVIQSTADATTAIGDRDAIVTETSSKPLLTEITVTPNPDPEFGGGGFTQGST